jgi:hypothetical protein
MRRRCAGRLSAITIANFSMTVTFWAAECGPLMMIAEVPHLERFRYLLLCCIERI